MKTNRLFTIAAALILSTAASQAVTYRVTLDTLALVGNSNAPFSLDFQLNDSDGFSLNNNSALLSNFYFGTGSPVGSGTFFGGASGDLSTSVTLADTQSFNEFYQTFTPGSTLAFDLSLTLNANSGPTPDGFSVSILDSSLANIPTTGLGDSLVLFNIINSPTGPEINFGTGTGDYSGVTLSAVPEVSQATLPLIIAGSMILRRRRRA
jgi:hypothetical protein